MGEKLSASMILTTSNNNDDFYKNAVRSIDKKLNIEKKKTNIHAKTTFT